MKTRNVWIGLFTMGVTLATAHTAEIEIFEGRGRAESRGAGVAEFAGRVAQRPAGGIDGNFTFTAETRNPDRRVRINVREVARFDVNGKVARFSGPGRLIVTVEGNDRMHEGTVIVEATDRKQPDRPGREPDMLQVRFESRTLPNGYHFNGVLNRGDIFVGERTR